MSKCYGLVQTGSGVARRPPPASLRKCIYVLLKSCFLFGAYCSSVFTITAPVPLRNLIISPLNSSGPFYSRLIMSLSIKFIKEATREHELSEAKKCSNVMKRSSQLITASVLKQQRFKSSEQACKQRSKATSLFRFISVTLIFIPSSLLLLLLRSARLKLVFLQLCS